MDQGHPKKKVKQEILDKIPELSKIEQGFDLRIYKGLLPSITRTKSLLSIATGAILQAEHGQHRVAVGGVEIRSEFITQIPEDAHSNDHSGQHDERNPVRDEGSTHGSHGYAQRSIEGADLCVGWGADLAISESWVGTVDVTAGACFTGYPDFCRGVNGSSRQTNRETWE